MPYPGVFGVSKSVRQPLRLQQVEAILAQVERFATFQVPILLVVVVQIERTPQTRSSPSDDDDVRRRHHQEDPGSSATADRMPHSFTALLFLAAGLLQTNDRTAQQTNRALLRHVLALGTGLFVVMRKQPLVLPWQPQQPRLLPLDMLTNDQRPSGFVRWSNLPQLVAPELGQRQFRSRQEAQRLAGVELVQIHADGDQLQVVHQSTKLPLGARDFRNLGVVDVVTE